MQKKTKSKERFLDKDLVPTFGTEFDNIDIPEFSKQIWTSESVNDLLNKVETQGLDLSKSPHPFFGNDISLKRGRVAFQMTHDEVQEFKKCKKDIIYFANKYVHLMTPSGIKPISLYSYQEEMLLNYTNNKNCITVGSRQIGKCVSFSTTVETPQGKKYMYELWWKNLETKNFTDYLKYFLYYSYCKLL